MTANPLYADLIRAGFSLRAAEYRHHNQKIYVWFVDEDTDAPAADFFSLFDCAEGVRIGRDFFEHFGSAGGFRVPADLTTPAALDGWMQCAFAHAPDGSPLDRVLQCVVVQIPELAQRLANADKIELAEIARAATRREHGGRL